MKIPPNRQEHNAKAIVVQLEVLYDVALKRIREREDTHDSRPFDERALEACLIASSLIPNHLATMN